MEWVEVRGKSTDVAIEAAMHELGASSREALDVEIMQEPEKGFLGFGGQDAIVKVKLKPQSSNRKRRRRRRNDSSDQSKGSAEDDSGGKGQSQRGQKSNSSRDGGRRDGQDGGGGRRDGNSRRDNSGSKQSTREEKPHVDIEEQAPVVEEFLTGLVTAFGLEGDVAIALEDDVIVADVSGPQTEAMVGTRGSTIEAIHELTKTVLQRQTQSSARVRLDIAGYGERRRQALAIYANQLIDQLIEDGGEVTLEPMSAGDRKVIHDAAGAREGVRSYSEGESPRRYVVLAQMHGSDEEE